MNFANLFHCCYDLDSNADMESAGEEYPTGHMDRRFAQLDSQGRDGLHEENTMKTLSTICCKRCPRCGVAIMAGLLLAVGLGIFHACGWETLFGYMGFVVFAVACFALFTDRRF